MICALNIGEKFSLGGITTLLGLGMTFLVLAILIGVVILVNYLIKKFGKFSFKQLFKKKNKEPQQSEETVIIEEETEKISPETKLAIESAVLTYVRESGDKPHENVKIVSITKK